MKKNYLTPPSACAKYGSGDCVGRQRRDGR